VSKQGRQGWRVLSAAVVAAPSLLLALPGSAAACGTQVITSTVTTRTALTITNPPAGRLTVRIEPHDAAGRAGPAATVTVA
jgi:hypothetical protein